MIPTRSVPRSLERAKALTEPAMRAAVERLPVELRLPVAYHLGWVDAHGRPLEAGATGGKGVRAALSVLSAEAVGAPQRAGIAAATAVELVHNFSLVHDDVIDSDATRRHRPTVWAVFGVGTAVVVGDALLALAQEVLLEEAPDPVLGVRAAQALARATSAMIAGQALDMALERVDGVDLERCRAMEAGKTGALLGCAASLGAVLGGAGPLAVAALAEFGTRLGLAFQAVDDLLGIWGDESRTGKPAGSDLRQGKRSVPVVAALSSGHPRSPELARLLALGELSERDLARAVELVEECGGREVAEAEAREHLAKARGALEDAPLVAEAREELLELASFVVERQF
jgi:geranylgeranyl diphosphate synthase type I